jgi:hypothetical protein
MRWPGASWSSLPQHRAAQTSVQGGESHRGADEEDVEDQEGEGVGKQSSHDGNTSYSTPHADIEP